MNKTIKYSLITVSSIFIVLILIFAGVPLKYYYGNPNLVKQIGPVHGAIFLLFVFNALSVGVEQSWKFKTTAWKVILACFVPFGTFYIDKKILSKLKDN